MCIFLVIGDGGNVDENNFARDDQRRGSMKRRSRSLRRKRRAQGKRGAFRSRPSSLKKKKKEGAANPRLYWRASIYEPDPKGLLHCHWNPSTLRCNEGPSIQ